MRYHVRNRRRLEALRRTHALNAIDYIEVSDATAASPDLRQRTLILQLLEPLQAGAVPTWKDVTITGGDRFESVAVEWVARGDDLPAGESTAPLAEFDDPATLLVVRTRRDDPSRGRGDHSIYTLRIDPAVAWGFDERLADVPFTFKVECDSHLDCASDCFCTGGDAADVVAPVIDYLAKDFPSLRRLMLDRLRVLMPEWREQHTPDLLVALTELVAYRADQLSYRQDAIATEALFATARDRVALRRHARMLDYRVDEGVAARAYLRFAVKAPIELPAGVPVLTARLPDKAVLGADDRELRARMLADPATVVFETAEPAVLDPALDAFSFWGYGEQQPVLPTGATAAALIGWHPGLRVGDALLLAESVNPASGEGKDVSTEPDRENRQIVRLTSVEQAEDPVGGILTDAGPGPLRITEIAWHPDDALRRPLCLRADEGRIVAAQAHGNLVLADHGRTMPSRPLPDVPAADLRYPDACDDGADEMPARYRPRVPTRSLAFVQPVVEHVLRDTSDDSAVRTALRTRQVDDVRLWLEAEGLVFAGVITIAGRDDAWSVTDGDRTVLVDRREGRLIVSAPPAAVSDVLRTDPTRALPAVRVRRDDEDWTPRLDLLGSGPHDRHFVAETDSAGAAWLRFGDDTDGKRPERGTDQDVASWSVRWRERGRTLGGVGRETLLVVDAVALDAIDEAFRATVATRLTQVDSVTNPLPATGGRGPISDETIRRDAPNAIWDQRRAVTPADYSARASSTPGIQRAEATVRWTGSWYTTAIAIDPQGGGAAGPALQQRVRDHVEPWRMAGGDLEIDEAIPVALTIELDVEVHPDRLAPHVERTLLRELGSTRTPDGRHALFHPDRVSFGQDIALSPIIAAAASVPGVKAVTAVEFRRSEGDTTDRVADGVIPLGRLEIAQCDNDPDHPDRGLLTLRMRGGR